MDEGKVLVIDQDDAVCELIKTTLSIRGYHVDVAQSGRVGLQLYQQNAHSLIFVDMGLTDLDARYIVRELRKQEGQTAVLIMAYAEGASLVQEALVLGAADYLAKPFRAEEIYFKVKHALEFRGFVVNNLRALKGIEERNLSLQKQNLLLARRIEESTRNLTRLYEDLRETYMRTIKALAHAIDARDHYTYSHSDNVTRYAELIARQMGLEMREIENIKDACQLHDLGKIGVHDNILSKPSALTPEEFAEIKLHSEKGAQILEPLNFMEAVIDIVKHHHERWDGKGYPDGLLGEAIPLGARIMTVADSYDAMVSARPYRKVGLLKKEAVEEIKRHSGAQFDPKVVEAFLKVFEQF
jgi:putative two-component system response regulator